MPDSFAIPTDSQRKRVARALQLDRSRLPIRGSFTPDGKLRGLSIFPAGSGKVTLALDEASTRPTPNIHLGQRTVVRPKDFAALALWARDHLVPAHDLALRRSCLVLPEMRCLDVLAPRPLPHYARGKALAQHSVEELGFKHGLRYVTNDLVELVEDPVLPDFPAEFAYGVSKAHRWPLLDEQGGCVIVPMDGFDVVVSMNLMHHHLAPLVLPPMKTFLDLIGVEATGNPFHNLETMAPYAEVVSDLRGLGARFLTELDREGLERLAGRPLKRAKK